MIEYWNIVDKEYWNLSLLIKLDERNQHRKILLSLNHQRLHYLWTKSKINHGARLFFTSFDNNFKKSGFPNILISKVLWVSDMDEFRTLFPFTMWLKFWIKIEISELYIYDVLCVATNFTNKRKQICIKFKTKYSFVS